MQIKVVLHKSAKGNYIFVEYFSSYPLCIFLCTVLWLGRQRTPCVDWLLAGCGVPHPSMF